MAQLSAASRIPSGDHIHGGLAPRSVGPVLRTAHAVRPHLPPIDALKPRLLVERAKDGFVTPGLIGHRKRTRGFAPGFAVWVLETGESGLGEDHWLPELLLDDFDLLHHGIGG